MVYLLAGLPDSYDILVMALENGSETVPPLESVTERLLREEQKMREKEGADDSKSVLMAKGNSASKKKQFTCHY